MSKITMDYIDADIKERRSEVKNLKKSLEDMEDYLDGLEARKQGEGNKSYTQKEMEERYKTS